jgi:hypothetical protein
MDAVIEHASALIQPNLYSTPASRTLDNPWLPMLRPVEGRGTMVVDLARYRSAPEGRGLDVLTLLPLVRHPQAFPACAE